MWQGSILAIEMKTMWILERGRGTGEGQEAEIRRMQEETGPSKIVLKG